MTRRLLLRPPRLVVGLVACVAVLIFGVPSSAAFARVGAVTASDPIRAQSTDGGGTSVCGIPGTPSVIAGGEHYDAYAFKNTTGSTVCVSVTVSVAAGNAWATAYLDSFAPANALANYLGGAGLIIGSLQSRTFSVAVPAGKLFVVVVEESAPGAGVPTYTIDVGGPGIAWLESGAVTSADPVRTQTTVAGGSTCGTTALPAAFDTPGPHYDAYEYKNTSGTSVCVVATVSVSQGFGWATAYLNPFFPGNALANYLGGAGVRIDPGATQTFSFNVPSGATFFVIVEEFELNAGATYTLTVAQNSAPTAVGVLSFTATASDSRTIFRWHLASEARVVGYNVFAESAAGRRRLNARVIPRAPGSGHSYTFVHNGAAVTHARYWLQVTYLDGTAAWTGPATTDRAGRAPRPAAGR
jgi:hypothetical protein